MKKRNFKSETLKALERHGKSWSDVRFVSNGCNSVKNLNKFLDDMDFEYDADFGGEEIDVNLLIVGDNWWLERMTYDGAEWWTFKTLPTKPEECEMQFIEDCYYHELKPINTQNTGNQ